MKHKKRSKSKKAITWRKYIVQTFVVAVISGGVNLVWDFFKPIDPRVKAEIRRIETAQKKDELFIELAKKVKGNTDNESVELIKKELLTYLTQCLNNYMTREEFVRERHRHIDKEKGVIWEDRMHNGCMYMVAVGPYTNKTEKAAKGK